MRLLVSCLLLAACDIVGPCSESEVTGPTACCEPTRAEFTVHEEGSLPAPTAELNFYRVALDGTGGAVRLPSLDKLTFSQELHVINVGTAAAEVEVHAPPGHEINGVAAGARWVVLKRSMGVLVRKQNATAYAGVQGDVGP